MRPMKVSGSSIFVILSLWLVSLGFSQGNLRIGFDKSSYLVNPASTVDVQIEIDPATMPDSGLFSYGVKMTFDENSASVLAVSDIIPSAEWDFNGVIRDPGARKNTGNGLAEIKGTVRFNFDEMDAFDYASETRLATVKLTIAPSAANAFTLILEPDYTLGETEELFVNGDGLVLDEGVLFESASVTINTPPIALEDHYSVDQDGVLEVPVELGLLKNDSDAETSALTLMLVTNPGKREFGIESRWIIPLPAG